MLATQCNLQQMEKGKMFLKQQNLMTKYIHHDSRSVGFKFNEIGQLQCPWEIK